MIRQLVDREAAALSRTVVSKIFIVTGNLIALALLVLSGFAAHVDRKKRDEAEAKLRFSQAELRAIVDSAADGIVAFNPDLTIRLINPAAAKLRRGDVLGAIGRSLLEFVPTRFRAIAADDVRDFLASAESIRPFAVRMALRSDGSEFPCDGSLTKSIAGDDQRFVTLMLRDLSESQAREARSANKRKYSTRSVRQFSFAIWVIASSPGIEVLNRFTGIRPPRRWVRTRCNCCSVITANYGIRDEKRC